MNLERDTTQYSVFDKRQSLNDKSRLSETILNKDTRNANDLDEGSTQTNMSPTSYFFKRTEKLTTALYLVTDFMSDSEPLKTRLREKSLELLSDVYTAGGKSFKERSVSFTRLTSSVEEIISMLEISHAVGLVSQMNFNILKDEYILLKQAMEGEVASKSRSENVMLSKEFFIDETRKDSPQPMTEVRKIENRNFKVKDGEKYGMEDKRHEEQKDNSILMNPIKGDDLHKETKVRDSIYIKSERKPAYQYTQENTVGRVSREGKGEKDSRREIILKLATKNKEINIKDVSAVVTDCSEKTLQRELLSLVADGILRKEGEKRWSKYYLA